MKIIISPAKKMNEDTDSLKPTGLPVFLDDADTLRKYLKGLSYDEQKKLWACNDYIAQLNSERFRRMDLKKKLTPAILAYEGIQYTYMAPAVFEDGEFDYIQDHLRILSGFYGVLKPFDGVRAYRLEMQAKASVNGKKDLYKYWGSRLYEEVTDESRTIINLASNEYSKCVEKYLQPGDRFITCIFGSIEKGKAVQKGVYAKMARGQMVRYMASHHIEDPGALMDFGESGYRYDLSRSDENTYVFIRQ